MKCGNLVKLNILQILKYYTVQSLHTRSKIVFVLLREIILKTPCTSDQSDSQIIFILWFNNCIEMIVKISPSIFMNISEVIES